MVRFQRQPPGTALTRASLVAGAALAAAASGLLVDGRTRPAGLTAMAAGALLLAGGHRANHGLGGPVDRMLTELFDQTWDSAILGALAWAWFGRGPHHVAAGALIALCASFLSSYVRARGAALGYSVEESHVTRGIRYALVSGSLIAGAVAWGVWLTAGVGVLATIVRTGQVAREERFS